MVSWGNNSESLQQVLHAIEPSVRPDPHSTTQKGEYHLVPTQGYIVDCLLLYQILFYGTEKLEAENDKSIKHNVYTLSRT